MSVKNDFTGWTRSDAALLVVSPEHRGLPLSATFHRPLLAPDLAIPSVTRLLDLASIDYGGFSPLDHKNVRPVLVKLSQAPTSSVISNLTRAVANVDCRSNSRRFDVPGIQCEEMSHGSSNKKVSNSLLALSSAAILAVYTAGYSRTRAAADRFTAQAAERHGYSGCERRCAVPHFRAGHFSCGIPTFQPEARGRSAPVSPRCPSLPGQRTLRSLQPRLRLRR